MPQPVITALGLLTPLGIGREAFIEAWRSGASAEPIAEGPTAGGLAVDKAVSRLAWRPVWDFDTTLRRTAEGYRRLSEAPGPVAVRTLLRHDIAGYTADARHAGAGWAGAAP